MIEKRIFDLIIFSAIIIFMLVITSIRPAYSFSGKLGVGPDAQALPVEIESSKAPAVITYSNGGKRLLPCPGTLNNFSFVCYIQIPKKIPDEFGIFK